MAEVLSYWSKRGGEAVKKYREFVLEGIVEGHREEHYEVKEQRYLGKAEFIEQVKEGTTRDSSRWFGPGKH